MIKETNLAQASKDDREGLSYAWYPKGISAAAFEQRLTIAGQNQPDPPRHFGELRKPLDVEENMQGEAVPQA